MKKLLTLIVLMVITISVKSQTLTATLQQGDVITPYYGGYAFRDAYQAAEDGAVITLSAGKFDNGYDIRKSIKIVGSGAFGDESNITYVNNINCNAENIRIEGVYFTGSYSSVNLNNKNGILSHCYVREGVSVTNSDNTIIDQCVINGGIGGNSFTNLCVKNSVLRTSCGGNVTYPVSYINCIIYRCGSCENVICRNNVIGSNYDDNLQLKSPGQYYNNVFFRNDDDGNRRDYVMTITFGDGCVNENNTVDTYTNLFGSGELDLMAFPTTEAKGDDNTKVGPEGGSGFKLYPSIPRIVSKSIDRQTNAEGKINVNIQVAAE